MNASHGNGVVIVDNDENMAIYLLFNNKESKTMRIKCQQANSNPLYAEITIQAGQQDPAIVISGGL